MPLFDSHPDDARIWINAVDRDLDAAEKVLVERALTDFMAGWSSHGRKVEGSVAIVEDRFIVVAAHIPGGDISGCGIDASVHALAGVAESIGFGWAYVLDVFFELDGVATQTDRARFAQMVSEGEVTSDTIVYDTSLTTVGEWRNGAFKIPAKRSWHARAFRLSPAEVPAI